MRTNASTTAPLLAPIPDVVDGRYRIVHQLADGGMGTVFLAEHLLIGRRFAIKVLHRDLAADTAMVDRFMKEALAAGTLGHPNIVEATDMGFTADRVPFIVFEYIEGVALTEEIYRLGGLPVRRALRIARQIASALDCAHHASIVHLDLKADNVLLTDKDGEHDHVKVLDFGIARFLEVDRERPQRHVIAGTPEYMAPEQVTSPERVDRRADVYALGVVLYEMLGARTPFGAAGDARAVLERIVHEPPPPLGRPQVPAALERLILDRMLAKDPAARLASMHDVEESLAGIAAAVAASRTTVSPHLVTRRLNGVPPLPARPAGTRPPGSGPIALPGVALGSGPARAPAEARPLDPATVRTLVAPPGPTNDTGPALVISPVPRLDSVPGPHAAAEGEAEPEPAEITIVAEPAIPSRRSLPAIGAIAARAVGPRRRARGWLAGALIAGAAGGALLAMDPPSPAADQAAARAALAADASQLAATVQGQVRSALARAEGVARAPMLRAAIETDADTIQDLSASEALFALAPGETVELFLTRGARRELAVRVPADAPALVGVESSAPGGARLLNTGRGLAVAVNVPVTTQQGEAGGALALAVPIDLGAFTGRVAQHARGASLVGLGAPVAVLRPGAGGGATERLSVPVPLDEELVAAPLTLDAAVASLHPAADHDDDAYACFAIAGLLLLMAAVRTADPASRLDA